MRDREPTVSLDAGPLTLRIRTVTLHVIRGPDTGRAVRVEQPTFVVGVGDTADLRLTDPGVSREHLRVLIGPSGVRIKDEGSKNGTYMGTCRVHDLSLAGDTVVTIGSTTIGISVEGEPIEIALSASDRFGEATGVSTAMRHLFAQLERAADSDLTVLIEGESGVGKDLLANGVHGRSLRRNAPFVVVDCGSIPENLIESELFGHERGAFTGADHARQGALEAASGGTVFLDEIGELPLEMQPKLLRALEAREVRPIGARAARTIDVRFVAATNRRLAEAARTGDFRSDLYYRLAVVKVTVPPLRERPEDILPIARAMLRALKQDATADYPADYASMLTAYPWPGNVRELRNVVERYAVLGTPTLDIHQHAVAMMGATDPGISLLSYQEARQIVLDRFEEAYVPRVLERANGVVTKAAELARVARPSFYRMLERVRASGRKA
ncbi:MAG: sigma 54-dependent Fis family transcriptional regulator [Labilithrix sp.]|nr:sigma 54-dependent Fis family transcriptional regulator [Labilithrix sp.]